MDNPIYLLTDYKGYFGSKFMAFPYRSGFEMNLLTSLFKERGFETLILNPAGRDFDFKKFKDEIVLYTSQEDNGLFYKGFLEDIVYALKLSGAKVVPSFTLLHAHENKVFFEMFRKSSNIPELNNLWSGWFGTFEEFKSISADLSYPLVIKCYHGSKSRGVFLAKTKAEAEKQAKKITKTGNTFLKSWDNIRYFRHKGYVKESWNRNKFIVQEFIPGLINDYKILIYGHKYYVLRRENKKGDFRASGQGHLAFIRDIPEGLLDYSEKCFETFNSPQASLDIGYNGKDFFLFEAQFIYFGTYTLENSSFYFTKDSHGWGCTNGKSCLEEEYVNSIVAFISK